MHNLSITIMTNTYQQDNLVIKMLEDKDEQLTQA